MKKELIEGKIVDTLEKMRNKYTLISYYGTVDMCFDIEKINYDYEDGILNIKNNKEYYIQLDIDDVAKVDIEMLNEKNIRLIFIMSNNNKLELETKENELLLLKEKLIKKLIENAKIDGVYSKCP